jgi:hypothetical protein
VSGSEIGQVVGGAISASLAALWYFYIPTYIRNRVAAGKEPAGKEKQTIKGNRVLAIMFFLGGAGEVAKILTK